MNKLKSSVRNTEIDGLSDTIVRIFKADKNAQSDAFLKTQVEELEKLSEEITKSILQDKILSTLEKANNVRNEAIKNLGTILSAYVVFPNQTKRELSAPLKAIADKYAKAGITNASYTSESSMIESMLQDYSAENLSENISGLEGITESIAAIRTAQDDFVKANDDYVRANTNKSVSATKYNKIILSLINDKLIPYLSAMVLSKSTKCLPFAQNVEAEINRVNDSIMKRSKKGAATDTPTPTDEAQKQ